MFLRYNNIAIICLAVYSIGVGAVSSSVEAVNACLIPSTLSLDARNRALIAKCLGWAVDEAAHPLCHGAYSPFVPEPGDREMIRARADHVSFYRVGTSYLKGHVHVGLEDQKISAETATIYRDPITEKITRIELKDNIYYEEPGRLIRAHRMVVNPEKQSGQIEDVLYRFQPKSANNAWPAWGFSKAVKRFKNHNLLLKKTTYSTCPPSDRTWQLEAGTLFIDESAARGVARDARLKLYDVPVLYTPYLTFPTTKERQSGFLMPTYGYSTIGGADLAFPYYWNIAPNYDLTVAPHVYSLRGVMVQGEGRLLTEHSLGVLTASILPDDRAYQRFLNTNQALFPELLGASNDRWSIYWKEEADLLEQMNLHINYQRVSDAYYMQDFSSNLSVITQNQLNQEGVLTYYNDHWLLKGTAQAYQTLNPINQAEISPIYQRLPQLYAQGSYTELPWNGLFRVVGQYDQFEWPIAGTVQPSGPRVHLNPSLAMNWHSPYGYLMPKIELVENYYALSGLETMLNRVHSYTIPRYSVDTGVKLQRRATLFGQHVTQTLEPRLYYLNVPYKNQSSVPAFDSAYMIFTEDQLFRDNRFSGQDRMGDANQMAYALTSRWLEANGRERMALSIGQLKYFSQRKVALCYQNQGQCEDNPWMLGYQSPTNTVSPMTTRGIFHLNHQWMTVANWVFDPVQRATNNADFNFQYQPQLNQMIRVGYSYLVNGNIFSGRGSEIGHSALHQMTGAYAWPFSVKWSGVGVYSYNLSERYNMLLFGGLQYDECCWAFRIMGGQVFDSLSSFNLKPKYNNNVYVQLIFKGLGTIGTSDAASTIQTYLPGYVSSLQR